MDGVWKQLEPGQIVNRRDCHGEVPIEHVSFGLYEHFRPLRRIPVPLDFLNSPGFRDAGTVLCSGYSDTGM